jgi:hypothetical protein
MAENTGVLVLPEHTCWTLLRSAEVARLAVVIDAQPDIFPINFLVDHGTIVSARLRGRSCPLRCPTPLSHSRWMVTTRRQRRHGAL